MHLKNFLKKASTPKTLSDSEKFRSPKILGILLARSNIPLARNADDQLHAIKISQSHN